MGLTVLDAGVIIGLLDGNDAHHAAAREAIASALRDEQELVLPASAYAECLVAPSRRGPDAIAIVDEMLDSLPVRVEPIVRATAAAAAGLRAVHGGSLRLPDALVVATALALDADRVITTDGGWPPATARILVL